jgi:cobyrinic acid a,c-diamide synthase
MLELGHCDLKALSWSRSSLRTDLLPGKVLRLGVAMDEAFCFYYPQNFELFRQAGFEIVEFSPVHDRRLPESLAMVYFGGGYPENFASSLEANQNMRNSIRELFLQGVSIYGECGGFMYLCESLTDMDGNRYDMVGLFPFKTKMNRRLRRLGYRRIELIRDCLLGRKGADLHGHEFHYSDLEGENYISNNNVLMSKIYKLDNNSQEGYSVGSAVGSYVHLHFGRTPATLRHLHTQLLEKIGQKDDNGTS